MYQILITTCIGTHSGAQTGAVHTVVVGFNSTAEAIYAARVVNKTHSTDFKQQAVILFEDR